MSEYPIQTAFLPAQTTAAVTGHVPADLLGVWLAECYAEIIAHLARHGCAPAGAPYARYRIDGDVFDIEAGYPVDSAVPVGGRVAISLLPAGTAVIVVFHGPYDKIEPAYRAAHAWLADHGRIPSGRPWEVYRTDPRSEPDPARWRTDVVVPYATR